MAPPNASPTAPPVVPLQRLWLAAAQGNRVQVHLLTGKVLVGRLTGTDQYCLALAVDGVAQPVLIFKHAVACLAQADAPSATKAPQPSGR